MPPVPIGLAWGGISLGEGQRGREGQFTMERDQKYQEEDIHFSRVFGVKQIFSSK